MFSPQRNLKYSKTQKGLARCKDYKHIHVGNTNGTLKTCIVLTWQFPDQKRIEVKVSFQCESRNQVAVGWEDSGRGSSRPQQEESANSKKLFEK